MLAMSYRHLHQLNRRRVALEAEAEDIWARSDGDELLAVDCEGHGRGLHADVGGDLPEGFAISLVDGCEAAIGLAVEEESASRGENA